MALLCKEKKAGTIARESHSLLPEERGGILDKSFTPLRRLPSHSCNDIRQKLVLESRDPILELQLLLLQAGNLQLVGVRSRFESGNFHVQLPMLAAELGQQLANVSFVLTLHARIFRLRRDPWHPFGRNIIGNGHGGKSTKRAG